jgi:hypothetical protein
LAHSYEKKETLQTSLKQVEQYENAFKQIREASGLDEDKAEWMDDLVKLFVKREMRNFSRYSYIKDMIAENDQLDDEISKAQAEIDKHKAQLEIEEQSKQKNIQRYKDTIGDDLKKQGKGNKNINLYVTADGQEDKDWKQTMKVLNALKVGVQNIFENIGCSNEHTLELVGTHGVTESNMMQYMGIIEMRTNEILQMYAAC